MKLLLCHNYYQHRGGEDESFEAEADLLEAHGHEVIRYTLHNDVINTMGRLEVARRTLWNGDVYRQLRQLIRREQPVLMHCTNIFPLISPSAYYAARAESIPVVQSLRNYRLLCSNGLFLRKGRICESCLGPAFLLPGILHGCYRNSRLASTVVAAMITAHKALGTWKRAVDLYFTPSEFTRTKYIEAGWPADKIAVKSCFVDPDPGPGAGQGGYAAFVGRLSPEKGLDTLLSAWSRLPRPIPLKIIGDGPLAGDVQAAMRTNPAIQWLGRKPLPEVLEILGDATCMVMPSRVYETLGRTILEAFSRGTPTIASRLGAMAGVVDDGRTGYLFTAGDADDLAAAVQRLFADSAGLPRMREAARQDFEQKYTATLTYHGLIDLYTRVLERRKSQTGSKSLADVVSS